MLKDNNLDLQQHHESLGGKLGDVLLTPTRIYVKPVLQTIEQVDVHAICHITGGGFDENIPRVLKLGQGVEICENSWTKPPVFDFLEKLGNVPHRQMFNVFNMGVGMVLLIDKSDVEQTLNILKAQGEEPAVIGKVVEGEGVTIKS